jgi:ADP-heptose:LPS heptosyltransferase
LIARLSALGDTVCSLPAAGALKRTFPGCHVTWAVDPRFRAVVEACEWVDEVVPVRLSLKTVPIYEQPFDAAFDLQGLLKSALCIARAKAPTKLGYHWQREGSWLFSARVLPDPGSAHVVDQYVDVVRAYGAQCHRAEFALKPSEEAVLSVRRKLKEHGITGRFLVFNAGAGWVTKRWQATSFAELADALDLPMVLVGGRADADREAADAVIEATRVNRPVSLIGETSVAELIALIRLCSAHVGGDTGSTHLAAAMDIPAIGLYSITRPERSCPYGQIENCLYHPESLAAIPAKDVLAKLQRVL